MPDNPTSLNVAVLMGGQSAEADVSRNSAAQVSDALITADHQVELIELDAAFVERLIKVKPDVVFPALHGPPGEDGTVQGCLEMLNLPYVGSGVHGSAVAMDKAIAKHLFRTADLPVADELVVKATDNLDQATEAITERLGGQVVIKPTSQGSAIGVTLLPNGGDLHTELEKALQFGPALVEPYILGKEITVGVLDNDEGSMPHPVIEIRTALGEWYDYTNRYATGKSEHIIPADLPENTNVSLQQIAVKAHQVLGLRDLSRADFLVTDNNDIYLLEVNSLPGMTPTSLYPDGAAHIGFDFVALMDYLVRRAFSRT
ncbi:MAG: D-alanine--D-alanine ligase [Pseudomonadota bacterium]